MKEFHEQIGCVFGPVDDRETVLHYGSPADELKALQSSAGMVDLSDRGRLCLVGGDRASFLHGQVTNDVKGLAAGAGCYAFVVTNKGKIQADAHVFNLGDELLLDLEPGVSNSLRERLESHIVADDVEVCDVQDGFALLSVIGPQAAEAVTALGLTADLPTEPMSVVSSDESDFGSIYVARLTRAGRDCLDLYVETPAAEAIADRLVTACRKVGGGPVGWEALEAARVEAGVPRLGADMDERNLAPETGLEEIAISYRKGCYIGQEVLNRLHTFAEVKRSLVRIATPAPLPPDTKLESGGKSCGYTASSLVPPGSETAMGLAYVSAAVVRDKGEIRTADGSPVSLRA